jgi:hypothetical protein
MSVKDALLDSQYELAESAAIGGALGLATHVVAHTAGSSSFVGGLLSGVRSLGALSM